LIEAYRELETRLAPFTADCMGEVAKHAVARRGRTARPPSRKRIARPLKHPGSR
jgi:hypothetical protein